MEHKLTDILVTLVKTDLSNMTENKLYAQCREEAIGQLQKELNKDYHDVFFGHVLDISQLTAEIYGMKLLDMRRSKSYYLNTDGIWILFDEKGKLMSHSTTKDLHDHFVREFNKEEVR